MTPGLEVLAPGLATSVQDLGRFGYQAIGVPVAGALDGVALRLANLLVGNPPAMAGFEILHSGPTFRVAADAVRIALGGADALIAVDGRSSGPVPSWQSLRLVRGDVFTIVVGRQSACPVLAVEGGVAVPSVLGSASTYTRAAIGGFAGRTLREGDLVPLALAAAAERDELRLPEPPPAEADRSVRIVLGPQQECFTEAALANLVTAEYRISASADRMGMRLDGPALSHRRGWDIASDAIATGAIQVPGSGQPILLLADHQTTGGYPKIATVVSADLPVVGRRRPGDAIRFAAVSVEEAEALARTAERRLTALAASFEKLPAGRGLDLANLYGGNLISGVVSAREG
jgi:allophanate hydrolase